MTKTNAQTAVKTRAATAKAKTARKPRKAAAPKVDMDAIVASKAANAKDSARHMIQSVGGEFYTFPTEQWIGEVRELTAIGQSFAKAVAAIKALPLVKPKAQLARGIAAKDAQQSAKAVADQSRGQPKASNKADAATQKPKAAPKADKASAKAEKLAKDDARKITFVAENPKRPGSASFDRFAKYKKGMTVAQALAAGVTRADIDWDSKREFIKFA